MSRPFSKTTIVMRPRWPTTGRAGPAVSDQKNPSTGRCPTTRAPGAAISETQLAWRDISGRKRKASGGWPADCAMAVTSTASLAYSLA